MAPIPRRNRTAPTAEILPAGDAACLVRLGRAIAPRTHARVLALLAALDADPPPGLLDLTPAYASLLVQFDPLAITREALDIALRAALAALPAASALPTPGRLLHVPVMYGGEAGPDLDEIARLTGLPPDEVVRRHAAATYRVYFLGFIAGFPYLGGLPRALAVPRLPVPRTVVPTGSVGLAERQTGIYPRESPGGWRLIGRTPLALFDPTADPPALLRPGDRVRFVPIAEGDEEREVPRSGEELREVGEGRWANSGAGSGVHAPSGGSPQWGHAPGTGETSDEEGLPWLRVLRPGPLTTVQDRGRLGYARYGVARAGAADEDALRLGNLLLGNPAAAACLEITLGGCAFAVLAPCAVVLTGADCDARLDDGVRLASGAVATLQPGQTLTLGAARRGVRTYLCVAGSVAAPLVLGSRSTDLRARLGGCEGRALRTGDVLYQGASDLQPTRRSFSADALESWHPEGTCALRVLPGPHAPDCPGDLTALLESTYTLDPRSDRMGLRLIAIPESDARGARPPLRGGQVLSEGVPRGAVQVPPGGEPILLLADAQTTGGYRVPAVVISADLARAAQLRPGDAVRFVLVSEDEALAALHAREDWLQSAASGTDTTARNMAAGGAPRAVDMAALARGFAEWSEAADPLPPRKEGRDGA